MDRRRFLLTSLAGALAPLAAGAQQAGKLHRIGILSPGGVPDLSVATTPNLVPRHLHELGYVSGRNLVVERRFADGQLDRLPALARDLLRLPVDVIVTVGGDATHAAKEVTATVPIVMIGGSDPVARGWVKSLSRPAGNLTGVIVVAETVLAAKRLELIREAVPKAARIAVLSVGGPGSTVQLQEAEKAAVELRVRLVVVEVQGRNYDRAFTTMITERSDALFVLMSPVLTHDRKDVIARAAKYRLPAIYEWREFVELGGLMSYGGSIVDLTRRAAVYVDKILKGANPGDLPVEQPTKYELLINLKTAKALGLTIPPSLLAQADQVIE
jgi:putative tryptophan/tyrosine transport system substrate-binding protein